jgi:thiol-disulfide isomerase/thioredoxin
MAIPPPHEAMTMFTAMVWLALAAPPTEIELTTADLAGVEAAVAKHKGKVVVIDVWATTCAPCVKRFPHIVEWHNTLGPKGLVVMSLSTDDESEKPAALKFLKDKKATFTNLWLKDTPANEKKYEEKLPLYPLPMLWVFDKSGAKAFHDGGKLKADELEVKLKDLLAK